uniref:Uncharacterized protein n=1 Tax=Solanum lycopersicum TaxID=4081 RepID=A0A3Q7I388_SOLLC
MELLSPTLLASLQYASWGVALSPLVSSLQLALSSSLLDGEEESGMGRREKGGEEAAGDGFLGSDLVVFWWCLAYVGLVLRSAADNRRKWRLWVVLMVVWVGEEMGEGQPVSEMREDGGCGSPFY